MLLLTYELRGWMRLIGVQIVVMLTAILGSLPSHAGSIPENFNGHYEMVDAKADRSFSLEVKQTDSRAEVSFSAAMADGSGAAPDGSGQGRVDDGVLTFDFKDSFNNEGTCTLEASHGVYQLSMTVLKVVDPSPFHFYGSVLLKKTSGQPQ